MIFFNWKDKVIDITMKKTKFGPHHLHKLLIESKNSPKTGQKWNFTFCGKPYLSFVSDRLFIFSGFIVLQGMMQINWKSEFNLFWKIHNSILKVAKNLISRNFYAILSWKFLSNFEPPYWLNCNQIEMKEVISITYGWNTIAWATNVDLGH